VVDLQNGCMAPGQSAEIRRRARSCPTSTASAPRCARPAGHVVYILNTIDTNAQTTWSNWFQRMSGDKRADPKDEAFADGSYGHLRWPGLDVSPADLKVKKTRFGAFVPGSSDLHAVVQARKIDTLITPVAPPMYAADSRRATQ
jgi:ureidoacrylate peracid hydrolase